MKIILLKDVKDIGQADTIKDVSDGFARNFLIPRGLAVLADNNSMKSLESRRKKREVETEKEKASLRETASRINGSEISILVDVGENGKLFGSVTHQDIAQKLYESLGVEIDKKKIILSEPIKSVGSFDVPVKFTSDITASLKVNVAPNSK